MAFCILTLAPLSFLGNFLHSVSLEYASTAHVFLQCYALSVVSLFASKLLEVTLILAGLERILRLKGSDYRVTLGYYWMAGPLVAVLAFAPTFFLHRYCRQTINMISRKCLAF